MQEGKGNGGEGFLLVILIGYYATLLTLTIFRLLGTGSAGGDGVYLLYFGAYAVPPAVMAAIVSLQLPGLLFRRAKIDFNHSYSGGIKEIQIGVSLAVAGMAMATMYRWSTNSSWDAVLLLSIGLFSVTLLLDTSLNPKQKGWGIISAAGIILLVIIASFANYGLAMMNLNSISDPTQRTAAASLYVRNVVLTSSVGRFGGSLDDFLLTGIARCQENALLESTMLNQTGLTTHIVALPGEDHAFVEVLINGTWYSSDPGYNVTVEPRWDRGKARSHEMGGLSLVYYMGQDGPEYITEDYVNTTSITIQVYKEAIPYSNGFMSLEHTWDGYPLTTPVFHLDANGTTTIQLGSMNYNSTVNAEHYYWVLVDGTKTNCTITSYGAGSPEYISVYVP